MAGYHPPLRRKTLTLCPGLVDHYKVPPLGVALSIAGMANCHLKGQIFHVSSANKTYPFRYSREAKMSEAKDTLRWVFGLGENVRVHEALEWVQPIREKPVGRERCIPTKYARNGRPTLRYAAVRLPARMPSNEISHSSLSHSAAITSLSASIPQR